MAKMTRCARLQKYTGATIEPSGRAVDSGPLSACDKAQWRILWDAESVGGPHDGQS